MMRQLDPTWMFTRNGKTKKLVLPRVVKPFFGGKEITVTEDTLLDGMAQEIYDDQDKWVLLADYNMKTLLEWGLDLPFRKLKI